MKAVTMRSYNPLETSKHAFKPHILMSRSVVDKWTTMQVSL